MSHGLTATGTDPSPAPPGLDLGPCRAAATVIIARDGPAGPDILVIERAAAMGFAGGAIAFPGGRVDPGDRPAGTRFPGFAGLHPADAAARIAAAREAFEEADILLSEGPPAGPATRARLRPLSDSHALAFPELLAELDHRLAATRLAPFARWLPPEGLHARFDTRFYLAALPPGEAHTADGREAVAARWSRPHDLLADADSGRLSLLFPTRCILARLATFARTADLLADPTPPAFVQPQVGADGWISIPDGLGYPVTRERLDRVRRA